MNERTIAPLGEQIIIRTIPVADSLNGIVLPDSAKKTTMTNAKGEAVHFVEAVVIACGPGRHAKGNVDLIPLMIVGLLDAADHIANNPAPDNSHTFVEYLNALARQADNRDRIPLAVKPGDRIVYHPSVQTFDRKVEGLEERYGAGDYFIILENSVLAVIE